MALRKCPECAGQVSTSASTCPHCGYPVGAYFKSVEAGKGRYQESATKDENDTRKYVGDGDFVDVNKIKAADIENSSENVSAPEAVKAVPDLEKHSSEKTEAAEPVPIWAGEPRKYDRKYGDGGVKKVGKYCTQADVDAARARTARNNSSSHILGGSNSGQSGYGGGNSVSSSHRTSGSYILSADESTRITLGTTKEAFNEFIGCVTANDMDGANDLLWSGQTFRVESGTSCTMEDWGISVSKVKITSGTHKGEIGYTASEFVK